MTVNELITGVNIALGNLPVTTCSAIDANGDGLVGINELIGSVRNALDGCPVPTVTVSASFTPTATVTATSTQAPPTTTPSASFTPTATVTATSTQAPPTITPTEAAPAILFGGAKFKIESEAGELVEGDFDGDGITDLATIPRNGNASILVGRGDGGFRPFQDTPRISEFGEDCSHAPDIGFGDVNGDGTLDVIQGTFGEVCVFLGLPGLNFAAAPISTDLAEVLPGDLISCRSSLNTEIVDANGDGRLDVVCLSTVFQGGQPAGLQLITLLGNGDGRFPEGLKGPLIDLESIYGHALSFADLDRSGTFDAVMGDDGGAVVALGTGDGSFGSPLRFTTGGSVLDLVIADVDVDGVADIVSVNDRTGVDQLTVLFGRGDGTFLSQNLTVGPHRLRSLAIADFDGDAILDLVIAGSTSVDGQELFVLNGLGGGVFAEPQLIRTSQFTGPVLATDLDGDEMTDIVAATNDISHPDVYVIRNDGAGRFFTPMPLRGDFERPMNPLILDIDGDGDQDVVASVARCGTFSCSGNIIVFKGGGETEFDPFFSLPMRGPGLAVGDVDGDGTLDLVSGGVDGLSIASLPLTPGTLPLNVNSPPVGAGLVLVDTDGQQPLEIIFTSSSGGSRGLLIWGRNEEGQFEERDNLGSQFTGVVASANLDDDEMGDLVVGTSEGAAILISRGNGMFLIGQRFSGDRATGVALGDVNGDGEADVVLAAGRSLSVHLSRGNGTYLDPGVALLNDDRTVKSLSIADINEDGIGDIVVGYDRDLSVWLGRTDGQFSSPQRYLADDVQGIAFGDPNMDDKVDLVTAGVWSDDLMVHFQK